MLRRATAGDRPTRDAMVVETVNWDSAAPPSTRDEVLADDQLARYLAGWPRHGDVGFIAEQGGVAVGAAWFRCYPCERPGFGFLDESIPEVSIAVAPEWRRRGIGTALVTALADAAREQGLAALSLSVESGNPAIRLYRRLGYAVVREEPDAAVMRLDL